MKRTIISVGLCLVLLTGCLESAIQGVEWGKDIGKAEAWKTLALQGDAEAQFKTGEVYCCGDRPRYDNVLALYWWCKAAKQNQRDALLEIGKLYEFGHEQVGTAIPRNQAVALTYYAKAVEHGNDRAVKPYETLLDKVSEEERSAVIKQLDAWPNVPCEIYR